MTVVWIVVGSLLLIVWVSTAVDIFRRHYSGWTTVGYLALIVILPFVGTLIYWAGNGPAIRSAPPLRPTVAAPEATRFLAT
jgi:hypothetical protein